MKTLSKTAQDILERLETGNIRIEDVKWNEVRSFRALESQGLIAQGTYGTDPESPEDYAKGERVEWYIEPKGREALAHARQVSPSATADLLVTEIEARVEVVTPDVPHTFTQWEYVECLKAFPRKGESGVWLKGRYIGVYPGDKRLAAVRIDGMNEAARVGEIRPLCDGAVVVAKNATAQPIKTSVLVYDQPALPTDEDVRRVLSADYPTIVSADGLRQHRNAGMLNAVLGTLAQVERTASDEQDSVDINPAEPATPSSTFAQLAADEPPVDPEADTEPMPAAVDPPVAHDPFEGMADFALPLRITPLSQRVPAPLEALNIKPSAFKRVRQGTWMSSARVRSYHTAWKGKVWEVGRWSPEQYLMLCKGGVLMYVNGVLAVEVRAAASVLETIFTAWAGVGWRQAALAKTEASASV